MRVGGFEVLSTIGRGGAGVVLHARAPNGAEVALKVLHARAPERLARFERERAVLASLGEAEGFVPLLQAGHDPHHGPFLVMPLVSGGTLRDRLRRGPLPLTETVRVGLELAETLGRAHARGIVHRDLKPENVLFTQDGRALVADLGLAKLLEDDVGQGLSRTGEMRGTVGYMAPEQADAKHASPAADVFALGAILYECLAGRPAFEGETPLAVLERVAADTRAPLAGAAPSAPRWLVAVVERALHPDPA
ncbi:MAG: serine/threonine protein kinase, partial [Planctomycetes bacterium]|nr:serine/threonine protein kinase [Planctomycetota bacterium]